MLANLCLHMVRDQSMWRQASAPPVARRSTPRVARLRTLQSVISKACVASSGFWVSPAGCVCMRVCLCLCACLCVQFGCGCASVINCDLSAGVGTLMPWNATLTAIDFFRQEYPSESNPDLWFTWLFQVATMSAMIALVPLGAMFAFRSRFVSGYAVYIVLLAGLPCLTLMHAKATSWILVLIAMPIFGGATGMVESSMYGYAALTAKSAVTFAQVGLFATV